MKPRHAMYAAGLSIAIAGGAFAQQDEKLGRVSFPTSCDPKVQAQFERGVAMLHSFWFIRARKSLFGLGKTCAPEACGATEFRVA